MWTFLELVIQILLWEGRRIFTPKCDYSLKVYVTNVITSREAFLGSHRQKYIVLLNLP